MFNILGDRGIICAEIPEQVMHARSEFLAWVGGMSICRTP
uniref:Uncharacterized protein n=1 Tax=Rhizophora mucronata TaxID=61149 RepID=A0A2P2PBR3_RHIMU